MAKPKKPKSYNFDGRVMTAASQIWAWYSPERKEALKLSEVYIGFHQCAKCGAVGPKSSMDVDHIEPKVPLQGSKDWNEKFARLNVHHSGLQVLCKTCHKAKTKIEAGERKKHRAAK